ncbi:MAG: protein kinase [Deltaproteobacteria bacterium]|nr:protein kinase [Deltaproteobacteria bacterium]
MYVVLEHVGSGGMGRVYRGEQIALGKTIAIKVIHQHLIADENATARFYTEARASSRLNHPNSVSVVDFGRTDEGLLYLVMEFLRGKDLSHILWEEGPLPIARAVDIVRQVLAALAEGHDLGIIHRDIKPENVIIERLRTGGDSVKVVDFGLAKVRADVAPSVTMPGIVCGTPDYMAPEQGRGDPPDSRSDLYAAGIMLFQLLTGKLPYEADSPTQVVLMHMTEPVPDARTLNPAIPEPVARVISRAMEKDAVKRYQSALEFAQALQDSLRSGRSSSQSREIRDTLESIICPNCNAPLSRGVKFCSECGFRMTLDSPRLPSMMSAPSIRPQPLNVANFVGRELELNVLNDLRNRALANKTMMVARISGDTGSGKTRLVHEFVTSSSCSADKVVIANPDPSWAGVPWHPVRELIRKCLEVPTDEAARRWFESGAARSTIDSSVRAGFDELFGKGTPHLDSRGRRMAVAHTMAFALRHAAAGAKSGVCVAVIRQMHRIEAASAAALMMLSRMSLGVSVLLIGTHTPRMDPRWEESEVLVLGLISVEQAKGIAASILGEWFTAPEFAEEGVTPMFADQTARWIFEGGNAPLPRTVDLISARFDQLPPVARKVLQALALIGASTLEALDLIIGERVDEQTTKPLLARWWIVEHEKCLQVSHEFIRDVVESATSAAVRTDLARRALDGCPNLALETRALLSTHTNEPAQALLLLETVADRATLRGDDLGAVHALRRGLDRARRELHRGELDDPERAMVIFARKLGDALARAGEVAEAEGVLREALELAPRHSVDYTRLECLLARALFGRGRVAEATRVTDGAIRTARKLKEFSLLAELSLLRADFDLAQELPFEAVAQLQAANAALDELSKTSLDPSQYLRTRVDVWLRMADALIAGGQLAAAEAPLRDAASAAHLASRPLEVARCEAALASLAGKRGNVEQSSSLYRRAATTALENGDADASDRYSAAANALAPAT